MKIAIVGTRGIPANYGGFETFAQELAPRLVKMGIECYVFCDKNSYNENIYQEVQLIFLRTTKNKNPLMYYFEGISSAIKLCDVIYVTGLGGAIFYPLLKRNGKILITNTDGIEYKREKWTFYKKFFLMISEHFAVVFSNYIVADSAGIKKHLMAKYKITGNKIWQLEYGAYINNFKSKSVLKEYGISDHEYYLVVSRLEPENNVHLIIEGFLQSLTKKELVIVGNIDNIGKSTYVSKLLSLKNDKIHFIGGIYDSEKLKALRSSCYAHLHGHSVGGTNPSLLEALGSGNIIIAHDNIFNREVAGDDMFYFKTPKELNDILSIVESLSEIERLVISDKAKKRITDYYDWDKIADRYLEHFKCCKVDY